MDQSARSPSFLQAFAPVGFALGFMLVLFAPLIAVGAFILWLLSDLG
jgi:hypothetical protein